MSRYDSDSSNDSFKRRKYRKKLKKKTEKSSSFSDSSSSESSNSDKIKPRRYRLDSRSRSHSRERRRSSKVDSSLHRKNYKKHHRKRSSHVKKKHDKKKSRSRSRGRHSFKSRSRSLSDSRSETSRSSRQSRSKSASSKRNKSYPEENGKEKNLGEEEETMKFKLEAVLKAAAETDLLLKEKSNLSGTVKQPSVENASSLSVDQQMERAQAIADINSSSFSQQEFISSRNWGKMKTEDCKDKLITESVCSNASKKAEASWRENMELLAHSELLEDQGVKLDRWKKKLSELRSKNLKTDLHV